MNKFLVWALVAFWPTLQAWSQDASREKGGGASADPPARAGENSSGSPSQGEIERTWRASGTSVGNKIKVLRGVVGAEGSTGPIIITGGVIGASQRGGYDGEGGRKLFGLLKTSEPLQVELKMSSKQRDAIKRLNENYLKKFFEIRNQVEFKEIASQTPEARKETQTRRLEKQKALRLEVNSEIDELLTSKQIERLDQIALQIRGPIAVAEPAIAAAIGLDAEQVAEIKAIVEEMNAKQREIVRIAFSKPDDPDDRSPYRPLPPEPKGTGPATKKQESGVEKGNAAEVRRTTAQERYHAESAIRMDWSWTRIEAARDEAIVKIGKRLGQLQKIGFNQMLGRRIDDLSTLIPDSFLDPPKPTASTGVK